MQSSDRSIVYISYGLPKSASSFVFQLASAIGGRLGNRTGRLRLDLAGVAPDLGSPRSRDIYAEWVMDARGIPRSAEGLDAALAEIEAALAVGPPRIAVIKTHAPCSPRLAARIAAGDVLASATFRHPADLVLSRLDMAARDQQAIDHDVLESYRLTHVPAFLTWHAVPGVAAFEYADVARQPYAVARRIADQLGLDEDVHDLVDMLLDHPDRIAQFNKGVVDRRLDELGSDEIARIEAAVPELMSVLARHPPIYTDPTFAIVIPSLNSAATIDESLMSVVSQRGAFRVRVHVQDGGSTDGTREKLQRWQRLLAASDLPFDTEGVELTCASEPDGGMYDALDRGFARVRGDVYGWLGSDDIFLPGAFQTVTSLLRCDPRIDWVTGAQAMTREDGVPFDLDRRHGAVLYPNREMLAAGLADGISAPFLQQEGTFWTDRLWTSVERSVRTDLRLAGDFELWTRMARHAEPVVTAYPLGSYRRRPGQLSGDMDAYHREVHEVRAHLPASAPDAPAPDPTQAVRVASVRWPEGRWRITHMAPRTMRRDSPDVTPAGPAGTAPTGWRVLGSDVLLEGPFPELGIRTPFVWVTGRERVLRVRVDEPGDYRVTLVLGNVHRGQEVRCSGPGFSVSRRAPNTAAQARPFRMRFQTTVIDPQLEVDLACSLSGSLAEDPRDLAVMLLRVVVQPAQRRGLRRRKRELLPSMAV